MKRAQMHLDERTRKLLHMAGRTLCDEALLTHPLPCVLRYASPPSRDILMDRTTWSVLESDVSPADPRVVACPVSAQYGTCDDPSYFSFYDRQTRAIYVHEIPDGWVPYSIDAGDYSVLYWRIDCRLDRHVVPSWYEHVRSCRCGQTLMLLSIDLAIPKFVSLLHPSTAVPIPQRMLPWGDSEVWVYDLGVILLHDFSRALRKGVEFHPKFIFSSIPSLHFIVYRLGDGALLHVRETGVWWFFNNDNQAILDWIDGAE